MGKSTYYGDRYFRGLLDEVAVFNRALSSSEVLALYQAGNGIPPTVEAVSPSNEAVNAAVNSSISITFSKPMNTASAEAAFKISPSATGTFSWEGNAMIFTPASDLNLNTKYTVTVEAGAKDADGTGLDGDNDGNPGPGYTFSFITSQYPPGLAVLLHFDEGSGSTVLDSSGNGNNGTWHGTGAHYTSSNIGGYAGLFNGTDDYVQLASQANTLASGWNELSMMMWVKYVKGVTPTYNRCSFIMHGSTGGQWQFHFVGGEYWEIPANTWGARFNDNWIGTYPRLMMGPDTGVTNEGKWHHLAATYKRNGKTYFYIDGIRQNTYYYGTENAPDYAIGNINVPVYIGGSFYDYGSDYLQGAVDEVAIYNRDLSSGEVLALYQAGDPTLPSSTYTTRVGSSEDWSWKSVTSGESVTSGTSLDWFWRIWSSGSGRKVPSGEAKDWIWGEE
jgi:hypothetical protein